MELSEEKFNEIKEEVKSHLKEHQKRYDHILGVVDMAEKLSKLYNIDPIKAKVASLLHDYAKYDTNVEVLNALDREECIKYPCLLHAYLSEYYAKTKFGIDDKDILNAIRNHVVGRCGMSLLEQIVFIADFTELGRVYTDSIACRKILFEKGINEAIIYSIESTKAHIDNNELHPNQLKMLKEYKEKLKQC